MKRRIICLLAGSALLVAPGLSLTAASQTTPTAKEYRLRAELDGSTEGRAAVMSFSVRATTIDTIAYSGGVLDYAYSGPDTMSINIRLIDPVLGVPTANIGINYPSFNVMKVPGEDARVAVSLAAGKVPEVKWLEGGDMGRDFVRLNHELKLPPEKAYGQLVIDNIIRGGDIRDYRDEFAASWSAEKARIMGFIRANPQSRIAAMELLEHFEWFDEGETERLYGAFPSEIKQSPQGVRIRRKLDYNINVRIGLPAPGFSKTDMNGQAVDLENLRGKYVLLDFWGTWCGPCRESHPHMVELHAKYGNRVEFIHIAQESGRDMEQMRAKWVEAVREDGMTWTQILNNEGIEDCDVVKLYHITAFPTKILIDPEGKIAGRYIGAMFDTNQALDNKLAEICR